MQLCSSFQIWFVVLYVLRVSQRVFAFKKNLNPSSIPVPKDLNLQNISLVWSEIKNSTSRGFDFGRPQNC